MAPDTQSSPARNRELVLDTRSKQADYAELLRTIDSWLADESGYDEETWPALKEALEANRSGSRRLFSD